MPLATNMLSRFGPGFNFALQSALAPIWLQN